MRYILDLSLADVTIVHYRPSLKAASAMCFSRKIIISQTPPPSTSEQPPSTAEQPPSTADQPPGTADTRAAGETRKAWSEELSYYSHYSEEVLQKCMQRYAKLLLRAEDSKYQVTHFKLLYQPLTWTYVIWLINILSD